MARKTEASIDTSALIAFADRSDTYHALFRRLFADPPTLITTTLVIAEGHGWFLKRYDRTKALQFLGMVDAMRPLKVTSVGLREQKAATELLRRFADQNLTLPDAVGLHLMEVSQIQMYSASRQFSRESELEPVRYSLQRALALLAPLSLAGRRSENRRRSV